MYAYYGLLLLAIDVYLAVHAYNTGRERWIFIILFIPFAGALVYLIVAWMPDMERSLETYARRRQWNRPQPLARTWNEDRTSTSPKELADPAQKLKMLKGMLDDELISQADYEEKKADILSKM
jgi:hypothetical protein